MYNAENKNSELHEEIKILKMFMDLKGIYTEEEYQEFKSSLKVSEKLIRDGINK